MTLHRFRRDAKGSILLFGESENAYAICACCGGRSAKVTVADADRHATHLGFCW